MSIYRTSLNLGLAAIVFFTLPLLASARPKTTNPEPEKKSIKLFDPAIVDGKTLAPGTYEIVIADKKASFELHGKTIVTAPCDWKMMEHKSPYNSSTLSDGKVLQEIQFQGSNEALEIM
ncbi:MAG TPA: hypothetical protein VHS29_04420 [Candidatus Acidoferrales bacterium]|nr:hypothetical protein [Candidatus Acidoferrales bacterium]